MFRRIESVARAPVWDGYDGRTNPALTSFATT